MAKHPPNQQSTISFTGERYIPDDTPADSHLAREHHSRYEFALSFVRPDDDVLDCASGAGYGSYMLSTKARSVLGCDISPEAVSHAASAYRAANLRYQVADAQVLEGLAEDQFSFVTSFETIEHIRDQRAYLRSMRRVLKPSGAFIMSMPNREFYTMAKLPPGVPNPYHINERSIEELKQLLREVFDEFALYGQNYYQPERGAHALQSLLLVLNRFALYRALRSILPLKLRNRFVENIGAAPKSDISPLDLGKGIPTNILAICR